MKKTAKNLFVVSLCSFAALNFTSCSDDDDNTPNLPEEPVETPTTMNVEGYYKGDIYDNGTANLWVNFISKDLKYDDDEEDYTGTGDIVCLDFNTTVASNPDLPTLADGTYTAADTQDDFTINIDGESYVVKYTNSVSSEYEVIGGTATVSHSGANTVITAQLELENGEIYEFEYTGPVAIYNRSGEGQMSNLSGDVTLNDLTQGVAMYYGEAFTETSDHYILVLAGKDFDLETNYGESASVMLGLNVTPGSTTGVPSGTYTVIDAMDADDYEPNTCLSGVYDPTYGGFFGTWYFNTLSALEASAQSGTVEVTNNGDGNYTIKFNLKDGYGHKITGEYTGHLDLEDIS